MVRLVWSCERNVCVQIERATGWVGKASCFAISKLKNNIYESSGRLVAAFFVANTMNYKRAIEKPQKVMLPLFYIKSIDFERGLFERN